MTDYALGDRQHFLETGGRTMDQKRRDAISWLDSRWVLHKANRVQKLPEPLPEVFAWKPARVLKRKLK
jgi:hypothetical protein